MSNVITYATLSVIPLLIGAYAGAVFHIKEKVIGVIAAFGAGAMIAALTFGLMEESFKLGGFDNSILGFIGGGILFVLGDWLIIRAGGRRHKRFYASRLHDANRLHDDSESSTGWGIVLGAVLDGIPESIALGIGLLLNTKVGLLVLVAIFAANLPEAISSAYDLKRAKKTLRNIMITWLAVALTSFIFVLLGYLIFAAFSADVTATFESIAAGAILAMLVSTMMPEAYKESGIDASLATVAGFLLIFILSKLRV